MGGKVFTIAPGAPFLKTFVEALLAGEIVEGLSRDSPPFALARAVIYVPTQRAGRALAIEFAKALNKSSALLPRIAPLGALEEAETGLLLSEHSQDLDPSALPALDEIERRLILAQLVQEWTRALERAIVMVDANGDTLLHPSEALLVSPSTANACALAKELGALIDEFVIENIDPSAIHALVDDAFDRYWSITAKFLQIAFDQWPSILQLRGATDASRRQKALLEAQIARLAATDEAGPVIALGSTGSNPTTARLISAIAKLDRGAVVLPALDQELDEAAWGQIGAATRDEDEPAFTHPQSMLKRLLRIMNIARDEPQELARLSAPAAARRALASQALRPADSTEHWRAYRDLARDGFDSALAGVAYLEAPDERLEALTLALVMREALETPGRVAALVTPDRTVARRVAAELARFDIEIDDSAGRPLSATPVGRLAGLLAMISDRGAQAVELAALLAHPLAAFGLKRQQVAEIAPKVQVAILRMPLDGRGDNWAERVVEAQRLAMAAHAHPAVKRLTQDDWMQIGDLLASVDAALAPLFALPAQTGLEQRIISLRAALESVTAASEDADIGEGAEELLDLLDRLENARAPLDFDAGGFSTFLDALLREAVVRGPRRSHPRLKILGLLEARLLHADLLLLAGLDEGVWPPQAETGPFFNRSMRAQLGLSPPERRIGQSAHDFIMAFGAPEVVLARAVKRDGAPTVVSRFVARLAALAGEAFEPCKRRGAAKLTLAQALDRPENVASCKRPEPRPPLELRPTQLSVTRVETLRRDPYAIYAERILKLVPLPALGTTLGAREMGTEIHATLEEFARRDAVGLAPERAQEALIALARKRLEPFLRDPEFAAFKWPRLESGLKAILAFDSERRRLVTEIHIEEYGDWRFPLKDGTMFRLTGVADRIEIDGEGQVWIFDYKTGEPPSKQQVFAGFSPQLTLEAAMLEAGAFEKIGKRVARGAAYLPINETGEPQWIGSKTEKFEDLVAEHRTQLVTLLDDLRDPKQAYPSRPYVAFASRFGDYDHLARVKEWSRGGEGAQE